MKTRSVVFYSSPATTKHGNVFEIGGQLIRVRAELRHTDFQTALETASPGIGETVLNSIDLVNQQREDLAPLA